MSSRIPNRFHFVFGLEKQTDPFHLAHYLCLESCRVINRPEKMYFYYCHEPYGRYWELIKDKLEPVRVALDDFVSGFSYKDRTIEPYKYAHHSDFIRLEKLIEHGGMYADIDTLFVSRIPDGLHEKSFVLGRENDIVCQTTGVRRRSLCNAFIMSEKNAPFATKWLEQMRDFFDGSWSNHSTLLPQQLSEKHPDIIHIEPPRTFYRHMWTREGIATLFEGCDTDFAGVVSMHLWSHLWWSRKRRDFSNFHAGLLTEEYVRAASTTYAVAARPFLPPPRPRRTVRSLWQAATRRLIPARL